MEQDPDNLYFIEGIMGQNMYLDILKQNLKQSVEKFGLQRSFKFYKDNDPKHNELKIGCYTTAQKYSKRLHKVQILM